MGLNARQKLFVSHYLVHKNATQAAIDAGYSADTAQEHGSRLLSNVIIKDEIQKGLDPIMKKNEITAERVLDELASMAFSKAIEPRDKNKSLELLGKYLKLFTDKIEIGDAAGIAGKVNRFKDDSE